MFSIDNRRGKLWHKVCSVTHSLKTYRSGILVNNSVILGPLLQIKNLYSSSVRAYEAGHISDGRGLEVAEVNERDKIVASMRDNRHPEAGKVLRKQPEIHPDSRVKRRNHQVFPGCRAEVQ